MSELINNSKFRKQKLKELIKSLHEGKSVDEVKSEFQKHFQMASTSEISEIEQALVKEGLAIEEIQKLCDVHASVFEGGIHSIHPTKDYGAITGHPINIFMAENRAIEKLIDNDLIPHYEAYKSNRNNNSYLMLRIAFDQLLEIDKHYARKENLFFPYLEKKGITAPPKVMWGVDDEIRAEIKAIINHLSQVKLDEEKLFSQIDAIIPKIKDMIFKEEQILIPLLVETLTLYNWIKIDEETPEIGYTLIKPTQSWKVESPKTQEKSVRIENEHNTVAFDAGFLLPAEINAILNTLPIDITFVDSKNKVKYFSQGKERIFHRPKTIIGRDVGMCHPPASVHIVDKIIESFRSGEKDHEDFWIRMKDMFIYIRYFAVRDENGNFLGTLEVSQNIKPITELEGEKRLLED